MRNTATLANWCSWSAPKRAIASRRRKGRTPSTSIKTLIARTQVELWTAYQWPTLKIRADTPPHKGSISTISRTGFLSSRCARSGRRRARRTPGRRSLTASPRTCIAPGGNSSQSGDPSSVGTSTATSSGSGRRRRPSNYFVRMIGMKAYTPLLRRQRRVDYRRDCISLFIAAELLARAKAEDAPMKLQKAQKYTLALMGNSISAKRRVSTLATGAPSHPRRAGDALPRLHSAIRRKHAVQSHTEIQSGQAAQSEAKKAPSCRTKKQAVAIMLSEQRNREEG